MSFRHFATNFFCKLKPEYIFKRIILFFKNQNVQNKYSFFFKISRIFIQLFFFKSRIFIKKIIFLNAEYSFKKYSFFKRGCFAHRYPPGDDGHLSLAGPPKILDWSKGRLIFLILWTRTSCPTLFSAALPRLHDWE